MGIDSGSEQTQLLAAIRATLNATSVTFGSKATGAVAYIATVATAYTGGIVLSNKSTTAAEIIWIREGAAAAADATSYPLMPGESLPLAWGNLHTISALSASGTPTIAWVGTTL